MAHKLLHGPKINASHDQSAGKGVAQAMPRESANLGFGQCGLKPVAGACEGLTVRVPHYGAYPVTALAKHGQRGQSCRVKRYMPRLTIFRTRDGQHFTRRVYVFPGE